jgi:CcmD family protein
MWVHGLLPKARLLTGFVVFTMWSLVSTAALAGTQFASDDKLFDESPLPYLLGVYTITWLTFFAYAFYMTRRQQDLRRQIDELRSGLDQQDNSA